MKNIKNDIYDTRAAQQIAPSVIMAYDLLPTSTMSPLWYADTTGLQRRYISPLQFGFHPGIRIFLTYACPGLRCGRLYGMSKGDRKLSDEALESLYLG